MDRERKERNKLFEKQRKVTHSQFSKRSSSAFTTPLNTSKTNTSHGKRQAVARRRRKSKNDLILQPKQVRIILTLTSISESA
jgi:hypothetical protein